MHAPCVHPHDLVLRFCDDFTFSVPYSVVCYFLTSAVERERERESVFVCVCVFVITDVRCPHFIIEMITEPELTVISVFSLLLNILSLISFILLPLYGIGLL